MLAHRSALRYHNIVFCFVFVILYVPKQMNMVTSLKIALVEIAGLGILLYLKEQSETDTEAIDFIIKQIPVCMGLSCGGGIPALRLPCHCTPSLPKCVL